MIPISEESQTRLRLVFTDYEGNPVIPSSFKYKIDDIASGTILKTLQTVNPGSSTYYLIIESSSNRIINTARPHEVRRITVEWFNGTTKMGTDKYIWTVVNQQYVPLT